MGFTLIKKYILSLIAYALFIWSAAMVAWLFLYLVMLDGEVIIREPNVWVRVIETIIAFGVFGFSIGVFVRFIKKSREQVKRGIVK